MDLLWTPNGPPMDPFWTSLPTTLDPLWTPYGGPPMAPLWPPYEPHMVDLLTNDRPSLSLIGPLWPSFDPLWHTL